MRTHATFHTFIVLMVVLTVSAPFSAIAQQNSVRIEAETAAARDANAAKFAAKAAAERDASNDLNKPLWFLAGMSAVGCALIGGYVGCLAGSSIDSGGGGLGFAPLIDFSDSVGIGCLIGLTAGALAPLMGIYYYQSNPPPERLLGKSPEYVEAYTNAYRAKTRRLGTFWAAAGIAGGLGSCLLGLRSQGYIN